MTKKILYTLIFLLIIVILGTFLWKVMVSPQYSLKKLETAIDEQDIIAFNKYVNLDETVDGIIVQTWNYYTSGEKTSSRWDKIRSDIGNSLLSVIKPNIKEILKEEILGYIAMGQWSGNDLDNEDGITAAVFSLVKEKIDPTQWDQQSINYTEIEDDIAYIGLTYYDKDKETNFIVEVKMRDMRGYWQITGITNIASIINTFQNIDNNQQIAKYKS